MNKILVFMKDEKFRKGLKSFILKSIENVEVETIGSVEELLLKKLKNFKILVLSSHLKEGSWLRVIPIVKQIPTIFLLRFPDSVEVNDEIAKRYGIAKVFNTPLKKHNFLAVLKEHLQKESKVSFKSALTRNFIKTMKEVYQRIETSNYYNFLGLTPSATREEIKHAYMTIAKKYHPDKFRKAQSELKKMSYEIAKRANEAFAVLNHPNRKRVYDEALKKNPNLTRFDFKIKLNYSENPEDTIQNEQVRRFVILAVKAMKFGEFKQAKTQLSLANSMEPGNTYIQELIQKVDKNLKN